MKITSIILLATLLTALTANAQRQGIIEQHQFNKSQDTLFYENSMHYPYSAKLTKAPDGSLAMRVEYRKGENIRAEFGTSYKKSVKEGWYGFSVYFPEDYVKDNAIESIVQWQAYPDFNLGESWRSAPLFIGVLNDRLFIDGRNSAKQVNVQGDFAENWRYDLGPLEKGKWLNFVAYIIWAPDNTGRIQLWLNDKIVYTRYNKPTSYNDVRFPYFKMGIYKFDTPQSKASKIDKRVVWFRNVFIGGRNSNYNSVYPGRKFIQQVVQYNDTVLVTRP